MTRKQLERTERRIWQRIDAIYGYQPFGIDARTLRLCSPGWYAALRRVCEAIQALEG